HLSNEAHKRLENPMKAIWKLAQTRENMLSLANGDPHPSLYPISQIDFKVPTLQTGDPVQSWTAAATSGSIPNDAVQTLSSYRDQPCAIRLQSALQYGAGAGLSELREILAEFNTLVHWPSGVDPHSGSAEMAITLTLGNADALTKCFRLLGSPGDNFLVEEFSFPGMTNAPLAQGIIWVPVRMDKEGILPDVLEMILKTWDEKARGRKPHVLYTIPSGQNPTGGTLSAARRREIYRIASEHDVIILEDDPYYFLQYDKTAQANNTEFDVKEFLSTFPPTFLSMDTEGRVIRIDSFSKIIFPGMRLGWLTSNQMFAHKLEVLTDSSTQHPHGIGQAFMAEMLSESGWGMHGYLKWVSSLCVDYQRRRDLFLSIFRKEMSDCPYATAESPSAGMFIWIELHYENHPRFHKASNVDESESQLNVEALNDELFQRIFDSGVVVMPAKTFAILRDNEMSGQVPLRNRLNFLRATFAGTDETISKAVPIVCREIKAFF
ncbi:L-tyrosine:2-oxoglutarate aminotransferase, partial [Fomitiporia mediterranea MF3/22]|uniref:L-tyrosine:2-oxoglutarate aminotransferase n=1 Tax=Fomitiporia mediterranea (strain MF3/22) TaxID=694068 RepID=UPI0004409822